MEPLVSADLAATVRLPPDQLSDLAPFLAMIRHSGFLAFLLVASVMATAIWRLLRIRRAMEARTSLHLLVNSIAAISTLIVVVLGVGALEIVNAPAVALQAFFHVECLPTGRTIVMILAAIALVTFICETRWPQRPL